MASTFTVDQPAELLSFLCACHPKAKRTTVRQWLKHGAVLVNGQPCTHSRHMLQVGDTVAILPKDEVHRPAALPRGMKLLYEDECLIVIDKPADLLSMASEGQREKTAYAFLTHYVRGGNRLSRDRVWIVHRLDRETSGVMLFAKSQRAQEVLQANWSQVEKHYLAIVEGRLPANEGVWQSHLDESHPYRVFSAPESDTTRLAVTQFRVLKQSNTYTLVELHPKTGRRNQLRVHLADVHCPIVGDDKYGARTNPVGRLGLHASSLQFHHPTSGERVRFQSPLPALLARLCRG